VQPRTVQVVTEEEVKTIGAQRPRSAGRRPSATALRAALAIAVLLVLSASGTAQVEELEVGARGHGFSVFSGTEPQRFEVEVLGVMKKLNPDTDFILARLSGMGLEDSGVVAGMSGSPVYVDGRLLGAVSFGWSFSNEAIAGITPIASMRELQIMPSGPTPRPPPSVEFQQLLTGEFRPEILEEHLRRLATPVTAGARSNLLWATVGFGDTTRSLLGQALGAVAPAGSTPDLSAELKGGSAVAGVMIDGDLRLAFTGTVTERIGDDILAFGHSFMGIGPLSLPMATAEVVTVISSSNNSFKLANIGPIVGAFQQDRFAGMLGRVGASAPTIPTEIRLHGTPEKTYRMEIASIPSMTSTLIATSVIQVLNAARQLNGNQGVRLRATIEMEGHEALSVERSFQGSSAPVSAAIYTLSVVSFILRNPDEEVVIRRVEIDLDHSTEPDAVTLTGAHADRKTVRPGDTVAIHLDLEEYRGPKFRHTVEVEIPDDADPGSYYLFLGDGASVDALRLQIEPQEPADFRQALEILRAQHSSQDFVVLGVSPGIGLVVDGRSLPDLPSSIRSIWKASGPLSSKRLTLAVRQQSTERLRNPLVGAARIDLRVEPRLH